MSVGIRFYDKYVNRLVGINGKKATTTLLDAINAYYNFKPGKNNAKWIEATPLDCPVVYIQSDMSANVRKKGNSILYDKFDAGSIAE